MAMFDLKALIEAERAYHESIKPVDVDVMLGDTVLTVRVPYLYGEAFDALAEKYPVGRNPLGTWFDLDQVMREHPDIRVIDGDEEDDLFVLRNQRAYYRWPDMYDALDRSDKESLRAVLWGLHIEERRKRLATAIAKRAMRENEEEVKSDAE
ncbi:hypothetical protein [Zhihengliuella sp. ISTPL4]|uniref:hypothetical protein n=1 Tax=Zhihengliuella sp. ISTPL4 TaxID=2058657 RepID=UPI000C7B1A1B|nr:hypothetical protein [Zhihengliuella sp. ISTPL4]